MRNFGSFLSNLRSSAGLSLEELAKLVESSKSTLSRLENDDVPQPFKGSIRKLVIALAEILCTSKKETDRYLELASIDKSLLTETEEIQLGFTPRITSGSPEVVDNLFSKTLWHPTARMRLIQFLFHTYGVDEVAKAIKVKREALQAQ
jgi:transcriptional regulator with XRE-family HTH domain